MIKGKSPEEIRKTFNIKNDFTPAEEEQVYAFRFECKKKGTDLCIGQFSGLNFCFGYVSLHRYSVTTCALLEIRTWLFKTNDTVS